METAATSCVPTVVLPLVAAASFLVPDLICLCWPHAVQRFAVRMYPDDRWRTALFRSRVYVWYVRGVGVFATAIGVGVVAMLLDVTLIHSGCAVPTCA